MSLPGVFGTIQEKAIPATAGRDGTQTFMFGKASFGPTKPTPVNLANIDRIFGYEPQGSTLITQAKRYLRLGGLNLTIVRVVGPAATTGFVNIGSIARMTMAGPGDYSGFVTLAFSAGTTGSSRIAELETDGEYHTQEIFNVDDLVAWLQTVSPMYITGSKLADGALPAAGTSFSPSAGNADNNAVNSSSYAMAAYSGLTADLGTGAVVAPDCYDQATIETLAEFCSDSMLIGVRDMFADTSPTATWSAVGTNAQSMHALPGGGCLSYVYPAAVTRVDGQMRMLGQATAVAAAYSRTQKLVSPGQPGAGETYGKISDIVTVPEMGFSERSYLNDLGVICIVNRPNAGYVAYGNRVCVDPSSIKNKWHSGRRVYQAVWQDVTNGAQPFVHSKMPRSRLMDIENMAVAVCAKYEGLGDLDKAGFESAYIVDATSHEVNPNSSLKEGVVNISVGIRVSGVAETIFFTISVTALDQGF